jgi:glutamate racemase
VLSVTVPGVEAIKTQWIHKPVLLATQSTVESGTYPSVMKRLFPEYNCVFISVVWTWLVDRIERKIWTYELIQSILGTVRNKDYDAIVLGCTHYPLITEEIQSIVGKWIPIINPGWESVHALCTYLESHTEIILQKNIGTPDIDYFVTWEGDTLSIHIDL